MQRFIYLLLSVLLLSGCVNWKARYYQSQVALERCINKEFDREVSGGDQVIVDFPDGVIDAPPVFTPVQPDTITVPDTVDNVITKHIHHYLQFPPENRLFFSKDSTFLWVTLSNTRAGDTLRQHVRIDSLKYPAKTRHHYRTVLEYITDWKGLMMAALIGFAMGVGAILFISRVR